jgi:hypothetical protein
MNYRCTFSSGLRFFNRKRIPNNDFWKLHLRLTIAWLAILTIITILTLASR